MKYNPIYILIINLLLLSLSYSNTINIKGTVLNNKNNPIADVNIFSDVMGTSSQNNGSFTIEVSESSIITFSHIGYLSATYKAIELPKKVVLEKNILYSSQIIVSGFNNTKLSESQNAVNIITNNEIKYGRENHFKDLISKIPNLTFAGGTSNPRYFLIRGIGEISQFSTEGNPNFSVGYIIDNIDFSGIGSFGATFDIDKIEVFKGPQNYIFGPNAMAGVINMKSLNPTPFLSTKATIGANTNQGYNLGISISNSITNNIAYRITGHTNYNNGFMYNKYYEKNNTNKNDESFLRTKLIWEPNKKLLISLIGFTSIQDNGYDIWSPNNNGDTTYTDYLGTDKLKNKSFSIDSKYKFQNSTIQSISTYSKIDLNYNYDGDWGNNIMWESEPYNWDPLIEGYEWSFNDLTERNRITKTSDIKFTKELNTFTYSLGAYIKTLKESDYRQGFLLGAKAESVNTTFNISNYSIYSNFTYKFSKKLMSNFGSRYSYYSNSYLGTGITNDENWNKIPINTIDEKMDNYLMGFHLSIKYKLNEKSNIFSSINRGYKAGGINQNPYIHNSQRFFKPEYNLNLNGGINYISKLYDANISLFYMKRYDQQVGLYYQLDPNNPLSFTYYTNNAISGYNSGIETNIKILINDNTTINFNSGILKNYIGKFNDPFDPNTVYGDREPAHSPKFNYSFEFNYIFENGLYFTIENTGMDEFFFDDQATIKSDSYSISNFNIGYKLVNWQLSLWGKNIFDAKYPTRGYYFDLGIGLEGEKTYKAYGHPAYFGISLEYNL